MYNKKLKNDYPLTLRLSIIVSLLLLIFTFYAFRKYEPEVKPPPLQDFVIEVTDIPVTEMFKKPPPPERPSIPVEADEDEMLDEVDYDIFEKGTNLALNELPPPPKDDEPEEFEYIAVSIKPEIKKRVVPVYPDLARRLGIEGTVVVRVLIDKKGNVEKAEIFKSIPMLDSAALAAARQCKFKPGQQRDKKVKVWMAIPFTFKLK